MYNVLIQFCKVCNISKIIPIKTCLYIRILYIPELYGTIDGRSQDLERGGVNNLLFADV